MLAVVYIMVGDGDDKRKTIAGPQRRRNLAKSLDKIDKQPRICHRIDCSPFALINERIRHSENHGDGCVTEITRRRHKQTLRFSLFASGGSGSFRGCGCLDLSRSLEQQPAFVVAPSQTRSSSILQSKRSYPRFGHATSVLDGPCERAPVRWAPRTSLSFDQQTPCLLVHTRRKNKHQPRGGASLPREFVGGEESPSPTTAVSAPETRAL